MPLLRARLETQGRAFSTHDGFGTLLQTLGSAPVRVANGLLLFGEMPDPVRQAWGGCLMLSELTRQAARTSGAMLCPRAFALVPGIESANFAYTGHCTTHRRLGCGTHGGDAPSDHQPNCLFEATLGVLGLKPKP